MYETGVCEAYNTWGDPAMETFLYHDEYAMFTEDDNGYHQLDLHIYYQLFECHT